ncbi:MAG: metalloprotease TldD [Casimicrobiaceae bacterium]|nr:metalloprotease TldD [Casimicrobiaceae bacterium]MDW8312183.1 metalloprotease TldD [Burkholderiales bacterium]
MDARFDALSTAQTRLLAPTGLSIEQLESVLGELRSRGIEFADLYFEHHRSESWVLEEGMVKSGNFSIEQGVGVRGIVGEQTAFAYVGDLTLPSIRAAAQSVAAIGASGQSGRVAIAAPRSLQSLYAPVDPLESLSDAAKVDILQRVERYARAHDPRVVQVVVSLACEQVTMLVLRSDGVLAADVRPLSVLRVMAIVEANGRREQGRSGGGGRFGLERFDEALIARRAREAVEQALLNLEARPAPTGVMPVVLGPGWPGVLLHEAVGHGLEGDFNRKGSSAFTGRIGERVAAPGVTVVDDGTLPEQRGSLNVDDEGTPTQMTVLIEDGILKGYMQDTMNARLMGTRSTGNGRRESYAHLPMPRMTNTYMLAGRYDPQEIIASVEEGLYAVNFGGGEVDITSGKFTFSMEEAWKIERGKLVYPVKGATLIGNGPDALTRVTMVGNDLKLDEGVGTCGKDGQSVPVGIGQPTLRIEGLTVGGTA